MRASLGETWLTKAAAAGMQPARMAEASSPADQRAGGCRWKVLSGLPVRKETMRRIMEAMQVLEVRVSTFVCYVGGIGVGKVWCGGGGGGCVQ